MINNQYHSQQTANILDWQSVESFLKLFPNIPEKTIRWQLSNRHANGLAPHIQKIGKQLYISISGYSSWLNSNHTNKSGK